MLDRDNQISLEMLLAEQLQVFYEIQPEMSTLQDLSAEIGQLEVVENEVAPSIKRQDPGEDRSESG